MCSANPIRYANATAMSDGITPYDLTQQMSMKIEDLDNGLRDLIQELEQQGTRRVSENTLRRLNDAAVALHEARVVLEEATLTWSD